jgi:hypothetical protein
MGIGGVGFVLCLMSIEIEAGGGGDPRGAAYGHCT